MLGRGSGARLLLQHTEFESGWCLQIFCTIILWPKCFEALDPTHGKCILTEQKCTEVFIGKVRWRARSGRGGVDRLPNNSAPTIWAPIFCHSTIGTVVNVWNVSNVCDTSNVGYVWTGNGLTGAKVAVAGTSGAEMSALRPFNHPENRIQKKSGKNTPEFAAARLCWRSKLSRTWSEKHISPLPLSCCERFRLAAATCERAILVFIFRKRSCSAPEQHFEAPSTESERQRSVKIFVSI